MKDLIVFVREVGREILWGYPSDAEDRLLDLQLKAKELLLSHGVKPFSKIDLKKE